MKNRKILLQRGIFLSQTLQKQGEMGLPRMCCTTVCLLHLFWRQIFRGRLKWMFLLVHLLQISPESLVACFQVILPRKKDTDKCSTDPNSTRRKKLMEFKKKRNIKGGEVNIWLVQAAMPFQ